MNAIAEILESIAHAPVKKSAITNHGVLNEAFAYAKPSSFSRGMRIDLNGLTILLISGTASIDEHGNSVHFGDSRFRRVRRHFFPFTFPGRNLWRSLWSAVEQGISRFAD